jgi:hypothetical protein
MSGRRGTLPASTFGGGSPVASLMVPPLSVPGFVTSSPPPSAAGCELPDEPDDPQPMAHTSASARTGSIRRRIPGS